MQIFPTHCEIPNDRFICLFHDGPAVGADPRADAIIEVSRVCHAGMAACAERFQAVVERDEQLTTIAQAVLVVDLSRGGQALWLCGQAALT